MTNKNRTFNLDTNVDSDERGIFTCHGNIFGFLDTHGSITQPGCFLETIPSFLETGFILDTHSAMSGYHPVMKTTLGYYIDAKEDDEGILLTGKFHSTHAAQEVRTQLLERQEDGKSSAMSIGFDIPDGGCFIIYPKDYDTMLPIYSQPQYLARNLTAAAEFSYITIITRVDLFECSICLVPSNPPSLIEEIRSDGHSKKLSDSSIYDNSRNFYLENKEKIMSELRIAKKLGKDTYSKLDEKLSKAEAVHEDVKDKLDEVGAAHKEAVKMVKDHGKALKDLRDSLDDLHKDKDDDDEKKDKKDEKDEKRSDDDLFKMLDEINKKLDTSNPIKK